MDVRLPNDFYVLKFRLLTGLAEALMLLIVIACLLLGWPSLARAAAPPCLKDPTKYAFMKSRWWTPIDQERTPHGWTIWGYCKRDNNQRPKPFAITCKHGVCDTAAIAQTHVFCKAQAATTQVPYGQCMSDKWDAFFGVAGAAPKPGAYACYRFTNEMEADLIADPKIMDAKGVWQPSADADFNAACAEGLALIQADWPDAQVPLPPAPAPTPTPAPAPPPPPPAPSPAPTPPPVPLPPAPVGAWKVKASGTATTRVVYTFIPATAISPARRGPLTNPLKTVPITTVGPDGAITRTPCDPSVTVEEPLGPLTTIYMAVPGGIAVCEAVLAK